MERQLSDIEREVAAVTGQWLGWIREGELGEPIDLPSENREIVSIFLALQVLRTEDARSILTAIAETVGYVPKSDEDRRALHIEMLWRQDGAVGSIVDRVARSAWVFGRNNTSTPFVTSDNPLAFRTGDNRMWLKASLMGGGSTYVVYPLAPDVVMYCYPDEGVWHDKRIARFDCTISPVTFTDELVEGENTAQVFMASRFLFSKRPVFDHECAFAKTVGTDTYAPPGTRLFDSDGSE